MQEVEKQTGGRVTFERHYGGDLSRPGEEDDQLKDGLIDFTQVASIFSPGTMPLWEMDASIPFRPSNVKMVNTIKWTLFNEFPELRAEIDRLNSTCVYVSSYGCYETIANRPLPDVASYKGLKVAVVGRFMPTWYSAIGGIPITMPLSDRYQSLQSGVIDASSMTVSGHEQWKFYETCKHHGLPHFGDYAAMSGDIRNDAWKKISAQDQETIKAIGQKLMQEYAPGYYAEVLEESMVRMKGYGVTFYDYTPEQRAQWAASIPNFAQQWINEATTDADHQVRIKMWKRYLELSKQMGYQWPTDWSDVK